MNINDNKHTYLGISMVEALSCEEVEEESRQKSMSIVVRVAAESGIKASKGRDGSLF